MTTRLLGYARLSSLREESTSIVRQRETLERYAAARPDVDLVGLVVDDGVSATKARLDRPGLTEARARIARGEADGLLVWRLDRVARNVADFGTLLDEGVAIVSATEPLDTTTAMGRAMAEILQVFAGMESRATAERVRNSVDYLRRTDRFPGMRVPFGYRPAPHPSGSGRILEIEPEAAARVQEAADRVLAGESLYAVARDFTERGVPTARGGSSWSRQTLRTVLLGEAVLGRVTNRGDLVRDEHGLAREVWPPILTVEESRRLRALFPASGAPARPRAARLLSGLAFCGSCDSRLVVQRRSTPRTMRGKPYLAPAAYRCNSRHDGRTCSAPVTISADRLDEYVADAFLAAVGRFEVVERTLVAPEPVALVEVEEALQETARALTLPGADLASLGARLARLHARREEVLALPTTPEERLVETGRTFAEEWKARDDVADRRALLLEALDSVEVAPSERRSWSPERIRLRWTS